MAYCPHCNVRYDETNETQPCCHSCGHPISCGCSGGHSYSASPSTPPTVPRDIIEKSSPDDDEKGTGDEDTDDSSEESFSPDDNLPF